MRVILSPQVNLAPSPYTGREQVPAPLWSRGSAGQVTSPEIGDLVCVEGLDKPRRAFQPGGNLTRRWVGTLVAIDGDEDDGCTVTLSDARECSLSNYREHMAGAPAELVAGEKVSPRRVVHNAGNLFSGRVVEE